MLALGGWRRHGRLSLTIAVLTATLCVGTVGMQAAGAVGCPAPTFPNYRNGLGPEFTTKFGVPLTVSEPGLLAGVTGGRQLRIEVTGTPNSANPSDDTSMGNATITYDSALPHAGFTYTPDTDPTDPFTGDDMFDYSVIDGCGQENFYTATVHVPPVVVGASYYDAFNSTLSVPVEDGFLANDVGIWSDPTDPTSAVLDFDTTTKYGGTVDDSGNNDGSFDYTPPANFNGIDTFTYSVWDIDLDNDYTATVSIAVGTAPPTGVIAHAQDHAATVSWTPAANPPTPVDSYTVTASPGGQTATVNAPATSTTVKGLTDGVAYTFTVHSNDVHGSGSESNSSNAVVPDDGAPPVIALATPTASVSLTTRISAKWTARDPSGILHYDTRTRVIPWNAASAPWANWLVATRASSAIYSSATGRTVCIDARATDNAGHTSAFTTTRCTIVPLHSNQVSYSSGWAKVSSSAVYGGFAYQSKTHGNTMTRTGIVAKQISIVLTRCSACGTIEVRWNNKVVKTYNLANRTTLHEQVLTVAKFSSAQKGTLTVIVTSPNGKVVPIEGLAIGNV